MPEHAVTSAEKAGPLVRWTCICGTVSRWLQVKYLPQSVAQHSRSQR